MTATAWTPDKDGLYLAGQAIPWAEVTLAQIRAAAPWYAEHAGVSEDRAQSILESEWVRRRGHACD